MDTLSDVLGMMRLRSCVYFQRDFAGPWGMEMSDGPFAQFHMVVRGRCLLKAKGGTTELASGDVVVFPMGTAHVLADDLSSSTVPGRSILEGEQNGNPLFLNGGEQVRLLCGHFEFDRTFDHPLVSELPELIRVTALSDDHPEWFEAVGRLLIRETASETPGASAVVERLGEILFIQVLRAYLLQNPRLHGFLGAIRDPQVNRALKAIHVGFSKDLSLGEIARQAGMSRSNLALRFRNVLGEPPMEYVTRWRLLQARELLKTSDCSIPDIAERVGYRSDSAFSHAFKRRFGHGPGAVRRLATVTT